MGDAASFVSVAGLIYSDTSGRAWKPQLDQSGEAILEAQNLETAIWSCEANSLRRQHPVLRPFLAADVGPKSIPR